MDIHELPLEGLKLIKLKVFEDDRGFFRESYKKPLYHQIGIEEAFVQDNHSYSKKGTLRGMHFQSKPGQSKLLTVVLGKIFDVCVDIRQGSPTFGKWHGVYLSAEEHEQLYIPVGFAHGFCILSEDAHILYKVTSLYDASTEKGFRYDDPDISIEWPIEDPLLSPKDARAPAFKEIFL